MSRRIRLILLGGALTLGAGLPLLHWRSLAATWLPALSLLFREGDAHHNLQWAFGILEQGWLNPHPYHPWAEFMGAFAPPDRWIGWYGGEAVFQQSPLYAYLLAGMLRIGASLETIHLVQSLLVGVLAALLGVATGRMFRRPAAGWAAFLMAILFAPFHAYAWPLIRDVVAWCLAAAALAVLARWWEGFDRSPGGERANEAAVSIGAGLLLGAGLLARESFLLLGVLVGAAGAWRARRAGRWRPLILLVAGMLLPLVPLAARNAAVGAPLLALSNRGPEGFIVSHAPGADPARTTFPPETGRLMEAAGGSLVRGIVATVAAHEHPVRGLLRLELRKLAALLDPFEAQDNINFYYLADRSPVVRWGLRFWFVLVPGLCGVALSLVRGGRGPTVLWMLLAAQVATHLLTGTNGRYRAYFALALIPWAGWFWCWLADRARGGATDRRKAVIAAAAVLGGWLLCLGPFARTPAGERWRPVEPGYEAEAAARGGDHARAAFLLAEVEGRLRSGGKLPLARQERDRAPAR